MDCLPKLPKLLEWAAFCHIINWWLNFCTQPMVFSKYVSLFALLACYSFFAYGLYWKKCTKSFAAIAHWMQYADDWSFVYMRWGLQIFLPCNQMARVFCPSGDKTNFRYCLHEMKWMTRHGHCAHWVSNDAKEMLFLFSNVWNGIESINTVLFALG